MDVLNSSSEDVMTILVVDDEPNILDVLQTFLENEGYRITTAESGAEAIARLSESEPHVVLLDIRMPDIDGIQCLRKIKSQYPDTEVVMMSGFATNQMALKSLEIGAFDYIRKPLEFDHLKNVIEQIKITKFLEMM